MTSTPCHSIPCGKNTSAPAATPRVPTSVTASGLMPEPQEELDERGEHDALPEVLEPVQHGGRRLPGPPTPGGPGRRQHRSSGASVPTDPHGAPSPLEARPPPFPVDRWTEGYAPGPHPHPKIPDLRRMQLQQCPVRSVAGATGESGAGGAYCGRHGAIQASDQGATMSDKSPRQGMTKKTGKSIKEKRADKRAKGARGHAAPTSSTREEVTLLGLGVIGTSAKENEYRLPLHPEHLGRPRRGPPRADHARARVRRALRRLRRRPRRRWSRASPPARRSSPAPTSSCCRSRSTPTWPCCARARCSGAGRTASRTPVLTQLAIDRRLTLIAFEVMNHWTRDGNVGLHVFHKNNELAGYCSVLQALQLTGPDRRLRSPAERGRDRLRRHRPRRGHRPQRPRRPRRRAC